MDMSYLNYVTAPLFMPAYMTFTFFLNPYLCHPNLYSCISYTMFTRLIFLLHVCATSTRNGYQDKSQTFIPEFAGCHFMGSGSEF